MVAHMSTKKSNLLWICRHSHLSLTIFTTVPVIMARSEWQRVTLMTYDGCANNEHISFLNKMLFCDVLKLYMSCKDCQNMILLSFFSSNTIILLIKHKLLLNQTEEILKLFDVVLNANTPKEIRLFSTCINEKWERN